MEGYHIRVIVANKIFKNSFISDEAGESGGLGVLNDDSVNPVFAHQVNALFEVAVETNGDEFVEAQTVLNLKLYFTWWMSLK